MDIPTYNIDVSCIEERDFPRTKAIASRAHTLGNPFNLDEVKRICDQRSRFGLVGALRRARVDLSRPEGRLIRRRRHGELLSRPSITMGEGSLGFTNTGLGQTRRGSFRDWGRDFLVMTAKTILAKGASAGSWATFHMATITNTPIRTSATI